MKSNYTQAADLWIEELLEEHGVEQLLDLPQNVLLEEISLAKADIANCKIWELSYGLADNEQYIIALEEALYQNQIPGVVEYVSEQVSEKLREYEVEITEIYQKRVKVKAIDQDTAVSYVKKLYNSEEIILDVECHNDTSFILVGDENVNRDM